MKPSAQVPRSEWLGAVLPLVLAGILLASVTHLAMSSRHGWLTMACSIAVGAAITGTCTVVLARQGRLLLRTDRDVARNGSSIERMAPLGWILGAALVIGGRSFGGSLRLALVSTLAGLLFGLWPGLFANFLRLRGEHHRD